MKLLSQALSIILYSLISFHVYFFNILKKTDILTIIKSIWLIYNSLIQSLYTRFN
jgi:hypothetical protein